jgi:hypothetical protein
MPQPQQYAGRTKSIGYCAVNLHQHRPINPSTTHTESFTGFLGCVYHRRFSEVPLHLSALPDFSVYSSCEAFPGRIVPRITPCHPNLMRLLIVLSITCLDSLVPPKMPCRLMSTKIQLSVRHWPLTFRVSSSKPRRPLRSSSVAKPSLTQHRISSCIWNATPRYLCTHQELLSLQFIIIGNPFQIQ